MEGKIIFFNDPWLGRLILQITLLIRQKYQSVVANIQQNRLLSSALNNIQPTERSSNNTWMLRYKSAVNPTDYGQTRPCYGGVNSYLAVGFYNHSLKDNLSVAIGQQIVPGMLAMCNVLSYTFSTLECFYSQSCIQMLIDGRLSGYEDVYLPVNLTNITALELANDHLSSLYFPSLEVLNYNLIDLTSFNLSYPSYFAACNVQRCTHLRQQKAQPMVIVTTVLGLIGGLKVILRLLIPLVVKVGKNIHREFLLGCENVSSLSKTMF